MCIEKKEIVGWLRKTAHLHKNIVENRLSEAKVGIFPAQHRILMKLAANPGINQRELAKKMGVTPATITISVKKLINEGYVNKECQKNDNRYNLLNITDKGKETIEKSIKVFDEIDSHMFDGFEDSELEQLKGYLSRIYINLSE